MNGCKQKLLHTKWWGFVHQPAFCSTPIFYPDSWFLIFSNIHLILFWIWALLACLDPVPQKWHHFVRTCCSAMSLRFSHSALTCLYGATHPFCKEMGPLIFAACLFTMLTMNEACCAFLHHEGVSPHKPYKMMGCSMRTKCTTKCSVSLHNFPYLQRYSNITTRLPFLGGRAQTARHNLNVFEGGGPGKCQQAFIFLTAFYLQDFILVGPLTLSGISFIFLN